MTLNESNLHNYQRATVDHIINHTHAGVFLDMGLGKTVSTLTAIKYLVFDDLEIDRVFIIAPKRVAENVWTAEQRKWSHLAPLKIVKVAGNEKKRRAALMERAHVYTISRDNLVWLLGVYPGLMKGAMCVIDESSSFKNPKANRFKALRQVQPFFSRVVLLTGTPAPNGLIDLWSQIYLLDRGQRLGKTLTAYREAYFKPGKRNGSIIYSYDLQTESEKQIHANIADICISMKAKDYLELPPTVHNYIELPFEENLRKQYEDFERESVLELAEVDGEISAINAAVLSNKLLQFASGAIYDDQKNWHSLHELKLEAAEDIVESASGKPVLFAWVFRHERDRLMERLKKYKPREIHTEQDIDDWNAGKIQVLLMHPASGGHGLNIQAGGNILVWLGMTWSLELYQQMNARLDRQGKTETTIINHLVIPETLDADVKRSLEQKDKKQDSLMQAVKARIGKYLKPHV